MYGYAGHGFLLPFWAVCDMPGQALQSVSQSSRVPAQMVFHECRNEEVGVAVAFLHAKSQADAGCLAGLPELVGAQSILQEAIRRPLVDEEFGEPVPVFDQ